MGKIGNAYRDGAKRRKRRVVMCPLLQGVEFGGWRRRVSSRDEDHGFISGLVLFLDEPLQHRR